MIQAIRAAALVGAVLGALAGGSLAATAAATPATATVVYTQATLGHHAASVAPATVTVAAGGTVTFDNRTGTQNLSISGPLAGSAKTIVIRARSTGSIALAPSVTSSSVSYSATEPADYGGLPPIGAVTKADGRVDVVGVPAESSVGGSAPAGSGGSSVGGQSAGQPSGGESFGGPGLPGGVIAPLAPGATAYPNGPAPLVAPFDTGTPSATPTRPSGSDASTPVAASAAPGGGPGDRALGLPAAITAVVLIGVAASLVRVLLTHPAGRATARRH